MPVRTTRNVSLTPELDAFVEAEVRSGAYRTASEVVRAALRLLQAKARRDGRGPRRPVPSPSDARPV